MACARLGQGADSRRAGRGHFDAVRGIYWVTGVRQEKKAFSFSLTVNAYQNATIVTESQNDAIPIQPWTTNAPPWILLTITGPFVKFRRVKN